jgi:hypothetical protein
MKQEVDISKVKLALKKVLKESQAKVIEELIKTLGAESASNLVTIMLKMYLDKCVK